MAITIDATVGGASSNSYVTLAEAETYFEKRMSIDNWTGTDAVKNIALANALMILDREFFNGIKTNTSGVVQALKWPRAGVLDEDGRAITSTTIPERIKDAQCELTLSLLDGDTTQTEDALKKFERMKVGEIDLTPRKGSKNLLPEEVRRRIAIFQTNSQAGKLGRA